MNQTRQTGVNFGLLFFSNGGDQDQNKYRLVLESAKFADQHGFSSVWVPERHFGQLGCLYPNPAVLHAALAVQTKQIGLRAGSVVVPLNDPLRVAEEWAMVDNLSGGRVGLSLASGWHPTDFALAPERYVDRHNEMLKGIEQVQKLWRGEAIPRKGGDGKEVMVRTYPAPVQKQLPIWMTAAGNPRTFAQAGALGYNLLTHLFNQGLDETAEKIAVYRKARADHGHDPAAGQVAVQIQTFVGPYLEVAREQSRKPFLGYLEQSAGLVKAIAFSQGIEFDFDKMSTAERDMFLNFVYERLLDRVLFGTPESCFPLVARLRSIGVDEVCCQVDFGTDTELTLQSLPHLARLKAMCDAAWGPAAPISFPEEGAPAPITIDINPAAPSANGPASIQSRCKDKLTGEDFYARLRHRNMQVPGPAAAVQQFWLGQGEALAKLKLPETNGQANGSAQTALLDVGAQILVGNLLTEVNSAGEATLFVTGGVQAFESHQPHNGEVWVYAQLKRDPAKPAVISGDVKLLDDAGGVLASMTGLKLQSVKRPVREGWPRYANWLYDLRWEPLENVARAEPSPPSQSWLVLADKGGVGDTLAGLLKARGEGCTVAYAADGTDAARIQKALEEAAENRQPLRGVVHLWGLDAAAPDKTTQETLQADQNIGVHAILNLAKGMSKLPAGKRPRLWIATRGAQPAGEFKAVNVSQAPLWGFGRTVALEEPHLYGGLADLDPNATPADAAAQLLTMLKTTGGDKENQVAFRGTQRFAPRLARMREAPPKKGSFTVRPDGSYWFAGGANGIGLEVARWMVGQGAKHVVLIGRTPVPPRDQWDSLDPKSSAGRQAVAIRDMESKGTKVHTAAIDIGDQAALEQLRDRLAKEGVPPVRGSFLTAVQWGDRSLLQVDPSELDAVMRPKVHGGWALHKVLADQPLDFFVLFSSAVSYLTALGQASYAAANAFLDSLTYQRKAEGKPILTINSGPWGEVGLSATEFGQKLLAAQAAHGIRQMTPKQGCEIIKILLEHGVPQAGIADIDWAHLVQTYAFAVETPMLARLAQQECPDTAKQVAARQAAPKAREAKDYVEPRNDVERMIAKVWQEVLLVEKVGAFDNFFTLGGHSIRAAIAANKLQEILGEKVHFVSLFDAQTVADLGVFLERHYPQALAKLFGIESHKKDRPSHVTPERVEWLRKAVAEWPIYSATPPKPEQKNPPAVFVLSAPRSGSTLMRVMLAGHPKLFAPPELSILSFETVADRNRTFSGRNSYRSQGSLRALQEINLWTEEQVNSFMEQCGKEGWSTQALYRFMQQALGDRLLVDKTPHYAMDLDVMRRAEKYFDGALYVHLVRHPYAMIRSWEEVRMDAVFSAQDRAVTPRELGELTWLLSNQNVSEFLREVPKERQILIRYEDLVKQPRQQGEALCRFLGLEFNEEMCKPYSDGSKRMTDGRGHLGDPNFHQHKDKGIDADRADRWKQMHQEDYLSDMTKRLAESFGYAVAAFEPKSAPEIPPVAPTNGSQVLDNLAGATESEVDELLKSLMGAGK